MGVYSTSNGTSASTPNNSTTLAGITNATPVGSNQVISRTLNVLSLSDNGVIGRNLGPVQKTGVHTVSYAAASTGTFASPPSNIFFGYTTTLNGTSNNAIRFSAKPQTNHKYLRLRGLGAKTSTAFRAGYFNQVGIANQRSPWSTAPTANSGYYTSPVTGGVAVDEAIYVTYKSVPGEFVYRDGSRSGILANYPAL